MPKKVLKFFKSQKPPRDYFQYVWLLLGSLILFSVLSFTQTKIVIGNYELKDSGIRNFFLPEVLPLANIADTIKADVLLSNKTAVVAVAKAPGSCPQNPNMPIKIPSFSCSNQLAVILDALIFTNILEKPVNAMQRKNGISILNRDRRESAPPD